MQRYFNEAINPSENPKGPLQGAIKGLIAGAIITYSITKDQDSNSMLKLSSPILYPLLGVAGALAGAAWGTFNMIANEIADIRACLPSMN